MNRTSTRFLSLALAVIFLLSAAGMSLNALFRGVEAHAEDKDSAYTRDTKVVRENGSSVAVDTNGRYILEDGVRYQFSAKVFDTRLRMGDVQSGVKNFDAKLLSGSGAFDIPGSNDGTVSELSSLTGDVTGVQYKVMFEDVLYRRKYSTDELKFSVTIKLKERTLTQDFSIPVVDSYDSNRYPYYGNDDDDDESSSSKADIEPPTPTIIVSQYDYGGGMVTAASDFTLRIRFTNTSKKLPVDNIVMKVTMPEAFTMTNSSNTFYVEKLSKQSSLEREVAITVKPSAEPISHVIKIAFTYEAVIDEKRKQLTSEQEISIPVSQLDRFSFTPIEAPPEIYVGDSSSIEAKFVNKGKSTVFNVTAEIIGNITQPGQRQFIGNIESGKEETADFLIEAKAAGEVQGEVIITYEDANMRVTTLRQPFNAMATAMDIQPPFEETMGEGTGEPPKPETWYGKIPIWTWVAGGAGLLIVMTFISKLVRHYREKKLLEDDDEDF